MLGRQALMRPKLQPWETLRQDQGGKVSPELVFQGDVGGTWQAQNAWPDAVRMGRDGQASLQSLRRKMC